MAAVTKPVLLFVVTEDWYFLSHRIALAQAANAAGYDVHLATRVGDHAETLAKAGITVHPLKWQRRSKNPFGEARALAQLIGLCRRLRPAIVHYVAMKMIVYGALVQALAPTAFVVNAVSGLGSVYSTTTWRTRLLRLAANTVLGLLLRRQNGRVIVQNSDDGDFFAEQGFAARDRIVLIPGAGIDIERFRPTAEPTSTPVVASVVARMLWDKGIAETIEAARILKERQVPVALRMVGAPDPENPNSVSEKDLKSWVDADLVDWTGHRSDIDEVWRESHIAVLASYREGLPRSLLEAAASGRPLVTTDTSGCRMLVEDDANGLVVPVGDAIALADAIARLVADPDLRARLGGEARQRVVDRFADEPINAAFLSLYRDALDNPAGAKGNP
ncbi:MAG: glycosyltransferase family 4 protein [Pseudomonadota bacterium]